MQLHESGRSQDLKALMRDYERTLIVGALVQRRHHQRRAAAALGILPTTLVEKMKRLGIDGKRTKRGAIEREPVHPTLH